jgi:hypothetical protein
MSRADSVVIVPPADAVMGTLSMTIATLIETGVLLNMCTSFIRVVFALLRGAMWTYLVAQGTVSQCRGKTSQTS